jgi:hypothetical protein
MTVLLPLSKNDSSAAWAGAAVAIFPKIKVAARTEAAIFLVVSSLLFAIRRDVTGVAGDATGAKADAPETQRRAMTAVKDLNIILIACVIYWFGKMITIL